MRESGFEVAAISSAGPQLEFVEQRDNIKVHQVPMLRRISPLADITALFRLFKTMRRLRPTIVHAHTPKGGLLGMIAACLARIPVRIFTLHGIRSATTVGIKKRIVESSEKLTCRLAQKIFAVSNSVCQQAVDFGYCKKEKIKVLVNGSCNGIDARGLFNPEKYPQELRPRLRRKYGIPENALVLCYVGRIVRDKGITELTEAWQRLRTEFDDLYLLMVGEYEPEDALDPEVTQVLDNDAHIVITGFVYDIPEHYLAADIVALPTHREGFGYVAIEGAAMELPIVATRVSGCVEAVEDGRTGVLVPAKNSDALYKAIKRLLLDKLLRDKLGQAGRKRVLECFMPEAIWNALQNEYVNLMRKRGIEWQGPIHFKEAR